MRSPAPTPRLTRTVENRRTLKRTVYHHLVVPGDHPDANWKCGKLGHHTMKDPRLQFEGAKPEHNGRLFRKCFTCGQMKYISPPLGDAARAIATKFCEQIDAHYQAECRMDELERDAKRLYECLPTTTKRRQSARTSKNPQSPAGPAGSPSNGDRTQGTQAQAGVNSAFYGDTTVYGWEEDSDEAPEATIEDMSTKEDIFAYFDSRGIKRNEMVAFFVHGAGVCTWKLLPVFDLAPDLLGKPFIWVKWGVTKLSGIGTLLPDISPIWCPTWPAQSDLSAGGITAANNKGKKRKITYVADSDEEVLVIPDSEDERSPKTRKKS